MEHGMFVVGAIEKFYTLPRAIQGS